MIKQIANELPKVEYSKLKVKNKLKLKTLDWNKSLIFKILFFKTDGFINNRSEFSIFWRSFLVSLFSIPLFLGTSWYMICLVADFKGVGSSNSEEGIKILKIMIENRVQFFGAFLATFGIIFWNLRSKFASQWLYCADLYNKIMIDKMTVSDSIDKKYFRTTLALDIVDMDMHANNSFFNTFNQVLEESIHYAYKKKNDETTEKINQCTNIISRSFRKNNIEDEIVRLISGSFTVDQARIYLSNYQNYFDEYFYNLDAEQLAT